MVVSTSMDFRVQRDVVYAAHDGVELLGDLYLPGARAPLPALVLIHGGAWQRGTKKRWESWGPFLAQQGYVTFAVSYRLSTPERSTFMESVCDVRSAVQYLRGRAAELNVDPERIGGLGHSAGGHLVALLALTNKDSMFAGRYADDRYSNLSTRINVAVTVSGVFDLIQQWEFDQLGRSQDQITEKYLSGTPATAREQFYAASPLYHASQQNAKGTSWLVAWGTADDIVAPEQSLIFARHLSRASATVRTLPLVGAGHHWIIDSPVEEGVYNRSFADSLLAFLRNWSGWWPHPRM